MEGKAVFDVGAENILTYVVAETVAFEGRGTPVVRLSERSFFSLSSTKTPQEVIAVCRKPSPKIEDIFKSDSPFLLVGENLNDPGNIGTIIRTAAAADATGVVLSKGSCSIYNPKSIRATAGTIFHIPIIENVILDDFFALCKNRKITLIASTPHANLLPYHLNLTVPLALLIGNESNGLSPQTIKIADHQVKIPTFKNTESLNASTAAAILLYETLRQRLFGIAKATIQI
ncbi:MAG: RNA methyltransferase [Turicibacter sp.]|nr:RNA methyltransferase [Turicibacter sp.]